MTPRLLSGLQHSLELGCGRRPFDIGFHKVDRLPLTGADGVVIPNIVWNLEETPWPWAEDNSCVFIIAHQTLEHLDNLIPVMNEIHRIAAPGAWVEIIVPYYRSPAAFQDPTHRRFFTEMTLHYWEPGMVEDFSDYGIKGHFAIGAQRWYETGNLWALLCPLKTQADIERWRVQSDPPPFSPPAELLARCNQYNFLGIAETV